MRVGRDFTISGGNPANFIAKWNGSNWSSLGLGMGPSGPYPDVLALAVAGSNVYAGGEFTTAGGSAANRIAKWDGNNWSALRSRTEGGSDLSKVLPLNVVGDFEGLGRVLAPVFTRSFQLPRNSSGPAGADPLAVSHG